MTPLYPLAKTVANINMDSWNVSGRTKDLTLVGLGASDLDDYVRDAAAEQGRVVHGDAEPEKGFYYRSDHFNFAKQGVPALAPEGGVEYIGKPADYGQKVREEWTANRYHKPADVVMPDWDLTGTSEDLKVYFAVGYRVAQADKIPEWKPGNEFKAKRDAMLEEIGLTLGWQRVRLDRAFDALRARQVRDPDRVVRQRRDDEKRRRPRHTGCSAGTASCRRRGPCRRTGAATTSRTPAAPRRPPRSARPAPTPMPATMSWPTTTSAERQPPHRQRAKRTCGADGEIDGLPDEQQQTQQEKPSSDAARHCDESSLTPAARRDYHRLHAIRDSFSAHARPNIRAVDPRRRACNDHARSAGGLQHRVRPLARKPRRGARSTRPTIAASMCRSPGSLRLKRGRTPPAARRRTTSSCRNRRRRSSAGSCWTARTSGSSRNPGAGVTLKGKPVTSSRRAPVGCRGGGRRAGGRRHRAVGPHQRRAADDPDARPERRNRAIVPRLPVVSDRRQLSGHRAVHQGSRPARSESAESARRHRRHADRRRRGVHGSTGRPCGCGR